MKNPKSINRDLENKRELDNLTRQIGELRLHVSKLENPSKQNEDRFKPRQTIECCLYCDSSFHQRRDCKELEDDLNKKRVRLVQGKIAEYDSGKLLKLNIGNGGMKALIRNENRHQARTYAITLLEKNLLPVDEEAEKREADRIRSMTGWNDPVDVWSVRAHLALVNEKRLRSGKEIVSGNDSKIQKLDAQNVRQEEQKGEPKKKNNNVSRLPSFQLKSTIESTVDIKKILTILLDSKVDLTLREILGIARKDMHELIIDTLKRKRVDVADNNFTSLENTIITDSEKADISNAVDVYFSKARETEYSRGYYSTAYWARPLMETKVRVGNTDCEYTALIDHGSEVNIIRYDVAEECKLPMSTEHGWKIKSVTKDSEQLYGACPLVPITIGNIEEKFNCFVQKDSGYPVLLGQPFISTMRMETKVLNNGAQFARIRSIDNTKILQIMTVNKDDERARGMPCQSEISSPIADFEDNGFFSGNSSELCEGTTVPSAEAVFVMSAQVCGLHRSVEGAEPPFRRQIKKQQRILQKNKFLSDDETIDGLYEVLAVEDVFNETIDKRETEMKQVSCNGKYKPVSSKILPQARALPEEAEKVLFEPSFEPILRDPQNIGHTFTEETINLIKIEHNEFLTPTEEQHFRKVILKHQKAFAFDEKEIGCVDPKVVPPMVIYTVPHVPWEKRNIPIPRSQISDLTTLIKQKLANNVLEPCMSPYVNRWFTVKKKNGQLRFIQDMQPVNEVTIRNTCIGPMVEAYSESFAGRAIYSMGDLYSGYDQFQLARQSRDLTAVRTPVGLLRMCVIPQGATNSVGHVTSGMYKVLEDFSPEITQAFIDDLPIKGCPVETQDETLDENGLRVFVANHIKNVDRILQRLEIVHLTLSGEKSVFGVPEIPIVGYMCGPYGRKPLPSKINAIEKYGRCKNTREVRRFLGACGYYRNWIPHYAHIAEPLYRLLRKGEEFVWTKDCETSVTELKNCLLSQPILRPGDYSAEALNDRPICVTIDTSPFGVGWAIGQNDNNGNRYAIRFGARVLTERERKYPQVKRELRGLCLALKTDREYLIGVPVIIETDCLPLLGMIFNCDSHDIAMLRWIAYIKTFDSSIKHIKGKDNIVADAISRTIFFNKDTSDPPSVQVETATVLSVHLSEENFSTNVTHEGDAAAIVDYLRRASLGQSLANFDRSLRKKAANYFLKDEILWKRPKMDFQSPKRVISKQMDKIYLITAYHDEMWAGHRGTWPTYLKLKEKFYWKNMFKDVENFVRSCQKCQLFSTVGEREELHPTYPIGIHFRWSLDIVHMPPGKWGMKYLVLARDDLTNFVEGRCLKTKHQRCRPIFFRRIFQPLRIHKYSNRRSRRTQFKRSKNIFFAARNQITSYHSLESGV